MEFDKDLRSIQEARDLAALGDEAAKVLEKYDEEQIDKIIRNMVKTAEEHAFELAQMAVEETGSFFSALSFSLSLAFSTFSFFAVLFSLPITQ